MSGAPSAPAADGAGLPLARWPLWVLLAALVAGMLVTLVWLAGRYEASQVQDKLERDTAEAVTDIRAALNRNVQLLLALQSAHGQRTDWDREALALLREHPEWVRIEWRDTALVPVAAADSP